MTTTTAPSVPTTTAPHVVGTAWPPLGDRPGLPARRLLRVELRKQTDTPASRWLLVTMVLSSLALTAVVAANAPAQGPALGDLLSSATIPYTFLVPVLGILAVTSEWSQRTALWTFSHEPRRGRVLAAKLVTAAILALGLLAVSIAGATAAVALAQSHGATGLMTISPMLLLDVVLRQVLLVAMGVGLGTLLRSAPLAISVTAVLPLVWTALGAAVPALANVAPWIDIEATFDALSGSAVAATDWSHVATSALLWVAVPLAVGAHRLVRDDLR